MVWASVAAGVATLLLRPRSGLIEPAPVAAREYFSDEEIDRARSYQRPQRALGLRHTPSLTFVQDNLQDNAKHIDELLAAARDADAEVQRRAAGARYAGDPQPYRLDTDDEDADVPVEGRA